jgi:hypothetical protein
VIFKFGYGYVIGKLSEAWNRLTLKGQQHIFVCIYRVNLLVERKTCKIEKKTCVWAELDILYTSISTQSMLDDREKAML